MKWMKLPEEPPDGVGRCIRGATRARAGRQLNTIYAQDGWPIAFLIPHNRGFAFDFALHGSLALRYLRAQQRILDLWLNLVSTPASKARSTAQNPRSPLDYKTKSPGRSRRISCCRTKKGGFKTAMSNILAKAKLTLILISAYCPFCHHDVNRLDW